MVKFCATCRAVGKHLPKSPGYFDVIKDCSTCPICKNKFVDLSLTSEEYETIVYGNNAPVELIDAMVELKDKDIIEFETKMAQFRASAAQIKAAEQKAEEEAKKPKCPKCKSTNVQIVPRKWSLFAGFATNKTDRVCANCKYKW